MYTSSSQPYDRDFAHVLTGYSQSHLMTLASLNDPANDISFVMQTIAKADHKQLFQAGNKAYVTLYGHFVDQKAELNSLKYVPTWSQSFRI